MADDRERQNSGYVETGKPSAVDGTNNPSTASDNLSLEKEKSQIVEDNLKEERNKEGGNFFTQLINLVSSPDFIYNKFITRQLDSRVQAFRNQFKREPTLTEWKEIEASVVSVLNNYEGSDLDSNDYKKIAYEDEFSNLPEPIPEETVRLPGNRLVRYAENDPELPREENDSPVIIIDALIYIQGVEVSEFLQGQVRISMSGTDGHNECSFTLDNSDDRFIWTERNLYAIHGESAKKANADYIRDIYARLGLPEQELLSGEEDEELEDRVARLLFRHGEEIKEDIYRYKTGKDKNGKPRNPPIKNPKNVINFARFDLAPGRPIFNRMDPVRIFSLYPHRVPGNVWETEERNDKGEVESARRELWMPEFTGYISNVSMDDDDIRGVSHVTIDCVDLREAVLRRMRISADLTSGLANPLDALGFQLSPAAQAGLEAEQTPDAIALRDEFGSNTEGYYNITNTQFYDDIIVTEFGHPFPNQPLEKALRSVLVSKEPITTEKNNRGVRGIEFGGNFYYDSLNFSRREAQSFLESWHKFCLFGAKRRPWTRREVEAVGRETTTDGDRAPNKVRLWFMLPIEGSGPKNLADLSQISVQMSHDVNWTNRMEIIQNFTSALDYNFMVTAYGDIICEFTMADFRPEDFGEFKQSFRVDQGLISSQFGAEQQAPPAGLIVSTGFAAGSPLEQKVAQRELTKVFVYSPYIAARYGIEIVNESLPYLLARDKALAQQRAVMLYQRLLARSHAMNMSFSYRPFMLPNRPVHHLRRYKMGNSVTVEKTLNFGQQPKGEINVGLEHIRLFTGHYRSESDLQDLNDLQKIDLEINGIPPEQISRLRGIDATYSVDPIELQVYSTVAAGESTPTSSRVGWSDKSILAPASGIYVLDQAKINEMRYQTPSVLTQDEVLDEEEGDYVPDPPEEPEETSYKFGANPLAEVVVTGFYGAQRARGPHSGTDFRADSGTECYAVEAGTIIRTRASQPVPGAPLNGYGNYGREGNVVSLRTDSGFVVQYVHLDDSTRMLGLSFGDRVSPGQVIGITGSSGKGMASGGYAPHLHISLIVASKAVKEKRVPLGTTVRSWVDIVPYLPGPIKNTKGEIV